MYICKTPEIFMAEYIYVFSDKCIYLNQCGEELKHQILKFFAWDWDM